MTLFDIQCLYLQRELQPLVVQSATDGGQHAATLQRCNVDLASVATDEDYVTALMGLFKSRGVRS